ncbi:hypothetical protein TI39_contig283g00017 [Zymoseptoria brevis]|uniref:Uncharacterized protein n=1 Tax=Zymoseptoria brevis TaxID=1047168 RepID=A0A0F4GZN2_9PEZI|nr:hypothetical protein TI39_contig283g00017 [Zymoseptoria brevis]
MECKDIPAGYRNDSAWTANRDKSIDAGALASKYMIAWPQVLQDHPRTASDAVRYTEDRYAIPYGVKRAGKQPVVDSGHDDQLHSTSRRIPSFPIQNMTAEQVSRHVQSLRNVNHLSRDQVDSYLANGGTEADLIHILIPGASAPAVTPLSNETTHECFHRPDIPSVNEPKPAFKLKDASLSPKSTSGLSFRSERWLHTDDLISDEAISPLTLNSALPSPGLGPQEAVSTGKDDSESSDEEYVYENEFGEYNTFDDRLLERDLDATQALQRFSFVPLEHDTQRKSPPSAARTRALSISLEPSGKLVEAEIINKHIDNRVHTSLYQKTPAVQAVLRRDSDTSTASHASFGHPLDCETTAVDSLLAAEKALASTSTPESAPKSQLVRSTKLYDEQDPHGDRYKDKFRRHKNPRPKPPGEQVPHHTERTKKADHKSVRRTLSREKVDDFSYPALSYQRLNPRDGASQTCCAVCEMEKTSTEPGFLSTVANYCNPWSLPPDASPYTVAIKKNGKTANQPQIRLRTPCPFPSPACSDGFTLSVDPIRKTSLASTAPLTIPKTQNKVSFSTPRPPLRRDPSTAPKGRFQDKRRKQCLSDPPPYLGPRFPFHNQAYTQAREREMSWLLPIGARDEEVVGVEDKSGKWKRRFVQAVFIGTNIGLVATTFLLLLMPGRLVMGMDSNWRYAIALTPLSISITALLVFFQLRPGKPSVSATGRMLPRQGMVERRSSMAQREPLLIRTADGRRGSYMRGGPIYGTSEVDSAAERKGSQAGKKKGRWRDRGDLEGMWVEEETWTR